MSAPSRRAASNCRQAPEGEMSSRLAMNSLGSPSPCAGTGNGRNALNKMLVEPIGIAVHHHIKGVVMEQSTVLEAASGLLVILNLLRRVMKTKRN